MTVVGGQLARDERAQRRAAAAEREATEAAKQQQLQHQPTTVTTLETEDGATVTLSTEEIRRASGDTPMAAGGTGQGDLGTSRGGDAPTGHGNGAGSGSRTATGGDGAQPRSVRGNDGGSGQQASANLDTTTDGEAVDLTGNGGSGGAETGRTPPPPPPPQLHEGAMAARGRGPVQGNAPQRPIIVREKAKALKLKKFKGLDDTMPVTMWLKTVRAEVRRQAVSLRVEWQERQLYHEVASNLEGEAQR